MVSDEYPISTGMWSSRKLSFARLAVRKFGKSLKYLTLKIQIVPPIQRQNVEVIRRSILPSLNILQKTAVKPLIPLRYAARAYSLSEGQKILKHLTAIR